VLQLVSATTTVKSWWLVGHLMTQIAAVEVTGVIEPSEVTVVPVSSSTTQPNSAHWVLVFAVQALRTAATVNAFPWVGQVMAHDVYPGAAD
tara:strand:- start:400 stop:672 length:273 start_codon:yes stop_codon:yes gene_type:complete